MASMPMASGISLGSGSARLAYISISMPVQELYRLLAFKLCIFQVAVERWRCPRVSAFFKEGTRVPALRTNGYRKTST